MASYGSIDGLVVAGVYAVHPQSLTQCDGARTMQVYEFYDPSPPELFSPVTLSWSSQVFEKYKTIDNNVTNTC